MQIDYSENVMCALYGVKKKVSDNARDTFM